MQLSILDACRLFHALPAILSILLIQQESTHACSQRLLSQITDYVRDYTESCVQIHPDDGEVGACSTFCDLYQKQVDRDDARWRHTYLGSVVEEWANLKLLADAMAEQASRWVPQR